MQVLGRISYIAGARFRATPRAMMAYTAVREHDFNEEAS
jgi:hypothetical protein